jgi:hypothetical protein
MQVLQNFVLSVWSDATAAAKDNLDAAATARYLGLYFGLGLGSVGVVLIRWALGAGGPAGLGGCGVAGFVERGV